MTVYVDDMRRPARPAGYRGAGTPRWSHMFADTSEELHEFAARIGMRRSWAQKENTHQEHYDLTDNRRADAIRLGAKSITYPAGTAELMEEKRKTCGCERCFRLAEMAAAREAAGESS